MSSGQTTADALGSIIAELLAADASDGDDIAQIGAALESVLTADGDTPAKVRDAVTLTLQALQAIYQGSVNDASTTMDAVIAVVATASRHLTNKGDGADKASLQEAADSLQALLPEADEEESADQNPQDRPSDQQDKVQQEAPAATQEPAPNEGPQDNPTLPQDADLELMGEFITECLDHISAGEASLLELESNHEDNDQINTVFRAFHTIKGTSGFLGMDHLQRLAHLAENLLDRARDGEIRIKGGYADLALKSCDVIRTMIEELEGVEPGQPLLIPDNYGELLGQLSDPEAAGVSDDADTEEMRLGDILVGKGQADRKQVEKIAKDQGGKPLGEALLEEKAASASNVAKALRTQKKITGQRSDATIRVGTGRLDTLINMVGELVIAHSMVTQDPDVASGTRTRLTRNVSQAGKIIRELQDLSMSLRMVPLKGTFQKMARLVRDLARKAGKSIQFITEGEDTEIDRNMVEVLNDPLVHMMRNAVDHGVETPDKRQAAGKDPTGTVWLRAYHSAGNVVIELQDDGKGLDRDKILAKAIDKGLIEPGKELTDSEAFGMIFLAGFSTAEKVTDVSGRGVGMDVVRKGIESLRGKIDVTSKPGEGSTFAVRVPLTMAITDGMLIRVGAERYLLPTISIERSFRPKKDILSTVTGRGEMVMVRGNLLPIFRLHRLFNVPDAITDLCQGMLIVVDGEESRCALMVDELLGQQQVVIKTLGSSIGHIPGVAGGAILGDGHVGLILDAVELVRLVDDEAGSQGPTSAAA